MCNTYSIVTGIEGKRSGQSPVCTNLILYQLYIYINYMSNKYNIVMGTNAKRSGQSPVCTNLILINYIHISTI